MSSPFAFPLRAHPTHSPKLHLRVTEVSLTQVGSWAFPTFLHQPRMFQTVPDRSSYVKVRHDSEFNKVMTRRSLPPTPTPIPSLVGGGEESGAGLALSGSIWSCGAPDQKRVAHTLRNPWLSSKASGRFCLGNRQWVCVEKAVRRSQGAGAWTSEPAVGPHWVVRSRLRRTAGSLS